MTWCFTPSQSLRLYQGDSRTGFRFSLSESQLVSFRRRQFCRIQRASSARLSEHVRSLLDLPAFSWSFRFADSKEVRCFTPSQLLRLHRGDSRTGFRLVSVSQLASFRRRQFCRIQRASSGTEFRPRHGGDCAACACMPHFRFRSFCFAADRCRFLE